MKISRKLMPETMYRASRFFRVLGNPTAYLILKLLADKELTPGELAAGLEVPVTTVSSTLRHLRQTDLVRYESRSRCRTYRIKDREVVRMLATAERLVGVMRNKQA